MKVFLVVLVLVAGCSASAVDDRHDARVLDSLAQPVFQNNPDLLLSKCYELSPPVKRACFDAYVWAKESKKEPVPETICNRIGCS